MPKTNSLTWLQNSKYRTPSQRRKRPSPTQQQSQAQQSAAQTPQQQQQEQDDQNTQQPSQSQQQQETSQQPDTGANRPGPFPHHPSPAPAPIANPIVAHQFASNPAAGAVAYGAPGFAPHGLPHQFFYDARFHAANEAGNPALVAAPVAPGAYGDEHEQQSNNEGSMTAGDGAPVRKRRRRMKKIQLADASDHEIQRVINNLDRKTRFSVLLHMRHEKAIADQLVKECLGDSFDPESAGHAQLIDRVRQNFRSFKHKTLQNLKKHVADLCEEQSDAPDSIARISDPAQLHEYFASNFSAESFLSVFSFVDGFLDVDNSSELGKYYMREVYANIATKMKLYNDTCALNPREASAEWKEVLELWDMVPQEKNFQSVSRKEFAEVSTLSISRTRRATEKQKSRTISDFPTWRTSGPPPPPSS